MLNSRVIGWVLRVLTLFATSLAAMAFAAYQNLGCQ
jgi:hypothetical protein